ncbi:hypothetical protein ACSU64_27950 [Bacillaceae bacterium C204]|uniref:hypothetical protein n=1 Tax=Neobacillus sp. 204 TaxID=3383351 RepID=UPI003977FE95
MAKKYVEIDGVKMEVKKAKKPFYKRVWVWALGIVIIAGIASGGGNDDKVSTGADGGAKTTASKQVDDGSKKFNAGISTTVQGLKINVAEVIIQEDKIVVGMNFENSIQNKLSFYPDQGNAIIGDMQLGANMFMGSGEVSGDINPGIKMDGTVEYLAPEGKKIDVKNVKEIKLDMGQVYNEDTYNADDVVITIPVK